LTVKGNSVNGVEIAGASLNTVGGPNPGDGNFILGNGLDGVNINGGGATGNIVQGNHIGINQTGATILGNHLNGVDVHDGASGNTITGNFIGANTFNGVLIFGANATGNAVQGNRIGTDDTGAYALGNGSNGVAINGISGNTISGNTISANGGQGVLLEASGASGNLVQGNLIGTDVTGLLATDANGNSLGNTGDGVDILSGASNNTIGGAAGLANVISGNRADGVSIANTNSTGNVVQGNFIGTDVTGLLPLRNLGNGVHLLGTSDNLIGGATTGTGNLISGNGGNGVEIESSATRSAAYTAPNLPVGIPNDGQLTSSVAVANSDLVTDVDVEIDIQRAHVEDLSITLTAPDGTVVPLVGANVVPDNSVDYTQTVLDDEASPSISIGTAPFTGSFQPVGRLSVLDYRLLNGTWTLTVSSNGAHLVTGQLLGWTLRTTTARGNQVEGNLIGTDVTGGAALGNAADGVLVKDALRNLLGGTMPGMANTIAFNGSAGVAITGATSRGNSILGNALFANTALGIDLGADGVTPNDPTNPDTGPNGRQNFPVLSSAVRTGAATTITGTLQSTPSTTFRIEFFSNPAASPAGFGQGEFFQGVATAMTDATGTVHFTATLPISVPVGQIVTATATNMAIGDSSEFSKAFVVPPSADLAVTLTPGASPAVAGGILTYSLVVTNNGPDPVAGAALVDNLPATLLDATWTCAASAGSSCAVAGGTGNVNTPVNLLVGGKATFTLTARVAPSATGTLSNSARAAPPLGVNDPNPNNNTATALSPVTPLSINGTGISLSAAEFSPFANVAVAAFTTSASGFEPASDFTATIAWGDGTTTAGTIVGNNGTFTVSGSHTYSDEGTFPIGVTIADAALGSTLVDLAKSTATVADRDTLTATGLRFRVPARRAFTRELATFTDANFSNGPGDFTATIDWGDGTTPGHGTIRLAGGTFQVTGSHAFRGPGNYKVTVTLRDEGGSSASCVSRVRVLNGFRAARRRKPARP
jgi:titin